MPHISSHYLTALYSGVPIVLCIFHRGGVTFNLITLLLCIPVQASNAEFNEVPPQLWICAPLFLLCLVQVLELTEVFETALERLVLYSSAVSCPGRAQLALHGGDGLVWSWCLLRLLSLGETDPKPWPRCHTYGLTSSLTLD